MKLAEIAKAISAHLNRIEADPVLNAPSKTYGTRDLYRASCWASGSRIGVRYVSHQGNSFMKKGEALAYLAWLDAGNFGQHYRIKFAGKTEVQP